MTFARDLVSGPLPGDAIDVEESAWLEWISQGPAEADPAAQGEAWADRLQAGDLPMSRSPGPSTLSVEGAELLGTVRLAAHPVHLGLAFQDALGEARLEAMRELAYGAGHEINNPLANIATRAQTLLLDERDPERRRRLSTIVDQAFRARDMIGGLMLFARPPRPHRVATDIHEMVSTVIDRLAPLAGQRLARLDYGPAPTPVAVAVDRSQVEEAIRAVVSNALDAVEDRPDPTVEIKVERDRQAGLVRVVVVDNGAGMDAETLATVFNLFVSTKGSRGTGLGLTVSRKILREHGGDIRATSTPGAGSTFTLEFPLQESADEPAGNAAPDGPVP